MDGDNNSNRVSLRKLNENDAPKMLEWLSNSDITRYLSIGDRTYAIEDAQNYIKSAQNEETNVHRAIVNENDEYLGTVSLKNVNKDKQEAEYAIAMHPSAIGTGAAAVATQAIIDLAFEQLGLRRVYLNVYRVNARAVSFYERFGFAYTHSTTEAFRGEDLELMWYEIVK